MLRGTTLIQPKKGPSLRR